MAAILIPLAISAATTGATAGLQYALTKKVKPTPVDRGRLDDIRISAPGFGASLIRGYGTYRVAPVWFWDTEPVEHTTTTPGQSGGKGGGAPPTPDTIDHYYTKSLAGAIGDKLLYVGVSRIWFNSDLVYNANATNNLADTSSTRYEAEHGVLAGGASTSAGSQYSNGFKVTGVGSGGSVTIHCDVASSATYEMAIAYTAASQKTFKVSVNGGATVDLVCRASGGAGLVAIEVMNVALTAGANTIAFSNSGASAPDLDSISIAPAITFTGANPTDPRSFTGLTTPGRGAPSDQDKFWPVADDVPVFSDTVGGTAGGGFYTATLSQWGNPTIRIYPGSEDQPQDSAIIADKGVDNTPAYRGTPYIVIDTLQITAQRPLPNVTVEVQQGMREVAPILTDLYEEVGVPAAKLDLTQIGGFVIGDTEGFNPGTYTAVPWTGGANITSGSGGLIHKTSGTANSWNAYANAGVTINAGDDVSVRFSVDAGTFMIGFSTTTTPGGSLPHPYDQVLFAVLINVNSKPSQAVKNAIQMSLGGSNNSNDVGQWARLDRVQVEIRNGKCAAYQNGLLLGGFALPVLSFPLQIVFAGYGVGGGVTEASYATGSNIGSEPIVANGGGLVSPQQTEAAELVVDLQTRFQFDMVEVDGVVRAVLRDQDAADITIPEDELRAHRKGQQRPVAAVTISDRNPIEIPHTVEINFLNPQMDFHNDTADDGQLISGPQRGINSISLNLIETRQNMKNLATLLRHKARMEAREYRFQTGPKYIKAHKGTRIDLQMNDGKVYKTTVDSMRSDLPLGVIEFTGKRHAADVFSATSSGFNLGIERPVVPSPGNTKGVFIDAPLVEPESAGTPDQPLLYVAMCGRGSGTWPGAFLLREFPLNSGVYEIITQADKEATIGITSGTLPTWTDPDTKDTTSSLIVDFFTNADLETVTEAELLANSKLNLFAIRNPSTGDVEYIQAQTVTPGTPPTTYVKRYTLTNLFRGRSNTIGSASLHTSADEVVLMNNAVKVLVMASALLGVACNYKFLTVGQDPDSAPVVVDTWRGYSLKATPPTSITGAFDKANNSLLLEWFDETETVPPVDLAYEIEIRNGNPGTSTLRGPLVIKPIDLARTSNTPPLMVPTPSGSDLALSSYEWIDPGGFNAIYTQTEWDSLGKTTRVRSSALIDVSGGFMLDFQVGGDPFQGDMFPGLAGIERSDNHAFMAGWTKVIGVVVEGDIVIDELTEPDAISPNALRSKQYHYVEGDRLTFVVQPDGTVTYYINYHGATSQPWWIDPIKLDLTIPYQLTFSGASYPTTPSVSFHSFKIRNVRWLRGNLPEFVYTGDMQKLDNSDTLPATVYVRVRKKSTHPLGPASDWLYASFTR